MRVAGRQKGSKQIPYTHALVQPSAPKSRYTFAYYSSEKKAKAAQKKYEPLIGNPLRVIKQSGKSANTDIHESLWDNIRKRRASGKPKLKPGQKGYPKTLKIEDAGVLSTRQQKERIKRLDKIRNKKADDAAERQKANDKEKQMTQKAVAKRRLAMKKEDTTTASIPNPATTAMGPSPFLDKRRKKDKSVMLTRFKKYIEDKGIVQKETIVDPNDLRGRPKKADPNPESPYGIKHPLHPANLKKKKVKSEAPSPSVLKPTKPTDIIKHAKTLAKNPRDFMMNKKKYLDKARAKVFRMYPNG